MLTALRGDSSGLGATREERRRRYGAGYVPRQRRMAAQARLDESDWAREAREGRQRSHPPAERYRLQRLMPDFPSAKTSTALGTGSQAAVAVFATMGAKAYDGDIVHRCGLTSTLMESRYVQYWIMRHSDHSAAELTATLAGAIDLARAECRDIVLPELRRKPVATPWSHASGS